MKVIEVRVDLTRNGPKQYESDKVGLTATLDDEDSVSLAIHEMKRTILGEVSTLQGSSVTKTEATVVTETTVKNSVSKAKVAKNTEPKTGGTTVSEAKAPVETAPNVEVEATKTEEPITTEAKTKVKVKASTKPTGYDRKLDTHKKLLSGFLDKSFPLWKDPKNLVKAGEASSKLVGIDFLDGEGEILQSFKDSFLSFLN